MRRWLASILAPEMARSEREVERLRHQLDDAQKWLGSQHPEVASLAAYILNRDRWFWSMGETRRLPWAPPEYVTGIDSFRHWLGTRPFDKEPRP